MNRYCLILAIRWLFKSFYLIRKILKILWILLSRFAIGIHSIYRVARIKVFLYNVTSLCSKDLILIKLIIFFTSYRSKPIFFYSSELFFLNLIIKSFLLYISNHYNLDMIKLFSLLLYFWPDGSHSLKRVSTMKIKNENNSINSF